MGGNLSLPKESELPPNHFVHHPHITLDDADDFGGNVFIHIVGDRYTGQTVSDEGNGNVDTLQESLGVDAAEDETAFVESFRPLRRCPYTDGWEGVADAREEGRLFREGAAVGHHRKGIHLQTVVIVEAQGFMLDYARIQFKSRGLEALPRARVAGIQDGHIILRRHLVDGREQRKEVLLRVNVLLPVRAQEDVLTLFEPKPCMDIRRLNLRQVRPQHLCHRRAGHIRALLREARIGQIPPCMLGIGHVHIRDDVNNPPVRLLRQALVLAAVAGFHMEDRDMQPLRANYTQTAIGIPKHQHGIGFNLHHQLVALGDDIAHGLAQVSPDGIHVHIRIRQFQVFEEYPVQVVVIVLARMRQDRVEILPALVNNRRQTDNFRARPHNDQKLQLPVIFEFSHIYFTGSKYVSGLFGLKISLQYITVTRFSVSERLMMLWV